MAGQLQEGRGAGGDPGDVDGVEDVEGKRGGGEGWVEPCYVVVGVRWVLDGNGEGKKGEDCGEV